MDESGFPPSNQRVQHVDDEEPKCSTKPDLQITDGGLAFNWITKDFDSQTQQKAGRDTQVLIMDGHSSHYMANLLEFCLANNIEYSPHCTHVLQGLNVVCFAKMKESWKEEINAFEAIHKHGVNKEDFCEVWGRAFKKAFTKENIKAAFAATGIWPLNPNVIKPAQMKPAEATSYNQPSHCCKVVQHKL
ncbi:LOW QUALITY PROTEIN: hypothetical protein CVT25_001006 [Psilocybe cyanescens]|uniref:DDE-1 domain-containing protein n=1 Tax=Psilocybe cyanescens TaxID=93625 RepID=A0A409XBA4_PSICY|nr:LOW QUALITY PROTEIN: hypothetical protein CVT25_001006 [Psilocybe cyanescens]